MCLNNFIDWLISIIDFIPEIIKIEKENNILKITVKIVELIDSKIKKYFPDTNELFKYIKNECDESIELEFREQNFILNKSFSNINCLEYHLDFYKNNEFNHRLMVIEYKFDDLYKEFGDIYENLIFI